jgi:hypothetical protein
MDLVALVALAIIVLARVLDIAALRALAPESRERIEAALLQTRMLSLGALVLALVAGAVAYGLAPQVPGHLVILGILVASIVAQAVLGTVALVRQKAESRYTTVFLVSRLVSAGAVAFLLAS